MTEDDVHAHVQSLLSNAACIQQILDGPYKIDPGIREYMLTKRKQAIAAAVAIRMTGNKNELST